MGILLWSLLVVICSVNQIFADGEIFTDVNNNTPHYEDIIWMKDSKVAEGWLESDGTRTFRPMDTVKRQDMAAFLRREAVLLGVESASTWKPSEKDWNRFSDVNRNTPHAEDILWMASVSVTTGYPDGSYGGMIPVYRQDMAAFVHRLYHLASNASDGSYTAPSFTDVNTNTPHYEDILWMRAKKITTGYKNGDGSWRYEGMTSVYRQDMAAFLHRMAVDNALNEYNSTRQALTAAQKAEADQEKVVKDANLAKQQAENAVSDATRDAEQAAENAQKAVEQSGAEKELTVAKTNVSKKQDAVTDAGNAYDSAKSDLADSQKEAADAQTGADKADDDVTAAEEAQKKADHAVDAAKQAEGSAQKKADASKKAAADAGASEAAKELADANKNLSEKKDALNASEQAEKIASDTVASMTQDTADAKTNVDKTSQAVTDTTGTLAGEKQNLSDMNNNLAAKTEQNSQAETARGDAEKKLNDAKTALDDAQKKADEADAVIAKGSMGWFESRAKDMSLPELARKDNQRAVDLLNSASTVVTDGMASKGVEAGLTKIGSPEDATSLENMKIALELIKIGNDLRVSDNNFPGLAPFKITDRLMAYAQASANMESQTLYHWLPNGGVYSAAGENAAWGYDAQGENNPYRGWYTEEKFNYENISLTDDEWKAKAEKVLGYVPIDRQTGHYLQLVYAKDDQTGLGFSLKPSKYGTTFVQNFGYTNSHNQYPTYDFDTYYTAFMKYYNTYMNAGKNLEQAKATYSAAKSDYATKLAAFEQSSKELNALKADVAAKEALIRDLETKLASQTADAAEAQRTLASLEQDLANAKAALQTSQNNTAVAKADVQKAQEAVDAATQKHQHAIQLENQAEADQKALETAKANTKAAEEAARKAADAVTAKKQTAQEAQEKLAVANTKVASMQKAVETKKQALAEAEKELDAAKANLAEVMKKHQAVLDAQKEAAAKKTALESAKAQLAAATNNLSKEQAKLETLKQDVEAKKSALAKAQENLKKMQGKAA